MILLQLFWEFFKVGLFAVGGGLATLPFLQELSAKTGWFTLQDLADMIAVSESTPGPIGVNMATYCGFTTAGILGSVCAVLGLVTPSVIIILIVALFLKKFRESRIVDSVFQGLRPASCAMITAAGLGIVVLSLLNKDLFQETGVWTDLFRWKAIALAAVVAALTNLKKLKKIHPGAFLAGGAIIGILLKLAE